MLQALLNQLNSVLRSKIKFYHELKTTLVEEKKVIGKGNIVRYQEFLLKKESAIKRIGDLGRKRKVILSKIAQEMGLVYNDISLLKIIQKANGPIGTKLAQSRKKLIELINAIDSLHTYNGKLVLKTSESNEKLLGFFNALNKSSSYAHDGKVGKTNEKSWMLSAEA